MPGFMLLLTPCVACREIMFCNSSHVPSIRVDGKREPLCRSCFDMWNQLHRIDKDLEPVELHPDAYAPEEA